MARAKKDNTNKPYFSPRLSALLDGMLTAKTTIISAPAGYGKTTAARGFFNQHLPWGAAIYHMDCVEEPAGAAWNRFGRAIQKIDTGIGSALLDIGLPDEDTKGDVSYLLTELVCAEETWLVIDDFQLFQTAVPEMVWNALIEYGAENLHTVILTQTPVTMR
ncbi:MAG: helix-turn-helix transcriptional regulator, partial [Clostridium sp.]|nr:helix-turn-helix transcriptional regulator [Clostridium sp.]